MKDGMAGANFLDRISTTHRYLTLAYSGFAFAFLLVSRLSGLFYPISLAVVIFPNGYALGAESAHAAGDGNLDTREEYIVTAVLLCHFAGTARIASQTLKLLGPVSAPLFPPFRSRRAMREEGSRTASTLRLIYRPGSGLYGSARTYELG